MSETNNEIPIEVDPTITLQASVEMGSRASENNAEAWAVGERGGVPVSSTDQTYHNNAKYYAQAAEDAAETASAAYGTDLLAPTYSATNTYAVGDHVIYNGGYYACNTAITTAEAWTAAHWTKLTVGGEASDLKTAFNSDVISNGFYPFGFENGRINTSTGGNYSPDSYASSYIRTIDYVPVIDSLQITFHDDIQITCCVYDSSKTFLGLAISNKRYNTKGGTPCIVNYADLTGTYSTAKYCRFHIGKYAGGSLDPDDYLDLVSVSWALKNPSLIDNISKTNSIEAYHSQPTKEATHNLQYPDYYDRTAEFGGYISGLVDGTDGWVYNSNNRYTTADYVPIDTTKHYQLQALGVATVKPQIIAYYDENKNYISKETGIAVSSCTFPQTAKYIRFSITSTQYNDYVLTNKLVFVSIPTASSPVYSDSIVTRIPMGKISIPYLDDEISDVYNSEKGYLNVNSPQSIRIERITSNGSVKVTFQRKLVPCFPLNYSNAHTALVWADITTNISSFVELFDQDSGTEEYKSATITVGSYRTLVMDTEDYMLYIREPNAVKESDFIILQNGYALPQGWAADIETYQLRLTSDDVILRQGVGRYNSRGNGFDDAIFDFSASLLNLSDYEAFLFATDPHIFGIGDVMGDDDVQKRIFGFFNYIESCYKSSPAMFVLHGGDWLNNSDTPAIAAAKLGAVCGAIRNTEKSYLLVGNHDTNYQGTERLSTQSMKNLWYNGEKTYFSFNGRNTTFYCFDSGTENQTLEAQNNLGKEQVAWFASSLKTDTSEHMAIAIHILYPYSSDRSALQPLTDEILAIAETYNSGGSITFDDVTYNYAEQNPNHDKRISLLMAGHSHEDYNMLSHGILCIVTKNAWIPSNSTMAFDFVTVDYDNSIVKTFRVGTGDNRVISMITGEIIS